MRWHTRRQSSGDNSTNLQAGGDINLMGLGYRDVKEVAEGVAMDVFRKNFEKLSMDAHSIAHARAVEFAHNLVEVIHEREPQSLQSLGEPGVQAAILEAQSGYARAGDSDLAELLIELLIQRVSRGERDTTQLAMDRALNVALNASKQHYSLLSCNLVLKQLAYGPVKSTEEVASRLAHSLSPFAADLFEIDPFDLDYLTGLGCLIATAGKMTPGDYIRMNYPGLFSEGFPVKDVKNPRLMDTPLVRKLEGGRERYAINAITVRELHDLARANDLSDLYEDACDILWGAALNPREIENLLVQHSPELRNSFQRCVTLGLPAYVNTAIGTAIAHSNMRRMHPDFDLTFAGLMFGPVPRHLW
ncbi:LPO_1073/Vpar_1526 family protein [Streptomyces gardneri]|uniref:LPO_1073/Vpar_1526 family protein n=1 Tax=Streptomyces gardneri TaxID=66892 RepID=UPI0036B1974D